MRLFLQMSEAESTGLRRQRRTPEMAARWHCGIPVQNLTPHYNCQFCVTFIFFFIRNISDAYKHIKGGLVVHYSILQFNSPAVVIYYWNYQFGKLGFLLQAPPRPNVVHMPLACGNVVPHDGSHDEDYTSFLHHFCSNYLLNQSE